jgi:hypothetical protein
MMEVLGVVQGIDYLERNLRTFMRPTRRRTSVQMRFGSDRITAIAAGNRVMLKARQCRRKSNRGTTQGARFPDIVPDLRTDELRKVWTPTTTTAWRTGFRCQRFDDSQVVPGLFFLPECLKAEDRLPPLYCG